MKQTQTTFSIERNTEAKRQKKRDARGRIAAAVKSVLGQPGWPAEARLAFQRLLACVRARSELLKSTPGRGRAGWVAPVFLLRRLRHLAGHHQAWLRPCESWQPPVGNLRPVFRDLAAHLLAAYPLPGFMDSAWDLPAGAEAERQQQWYIRLGRGAKLRELDLPMPLTRRMEHFARQAPDHYTVWQALRYGEVRGMDGSHPLAREIALGRLGREVTQPAFWQTVVRFFVRATNVPLDQVNPIIDFIQAQRFGDDPLPTERGLESPPPPCPEFSMQGRTVNSLLRLTRAWHGELAQDRSGPVFSWAKSGIPEYQFLDRRSEAEESRLWTIRELLDSAALRLEGQVMRHCVRTYAPLCWRRQTTIWSLRLRINDHEKRIGTLEVHPRRRAIIQARAKANARLGENSFAIVRQWAAWAGLEIEVRPRGV